MHTPLNFSFHRTLTGEELIYDGDITRGGNSPWPECSLHNSIWLLIFLAKKCRRLEHDPFKIWPLDYLGKKLNPFITPSMTAHRIPTSFPVEKIPESWSRQQ